MLAAVTDPGEDSAAVDAILLRLTDNHATVRAQAIKSLAKVCPASVSVQIEEVPFEIRRALLDNSRLVREAAATALSQVCLQNDARAIQDLVKVLGDEVPAVRAAAIRSLAALAVVGDRYVIQQITNRTDGATETSVDVLDAAYLALQILQGGVVTTVQKKLHDDKKKMLKMDRQVKFSGEPSKQRQQQPNFAVAAARTHTERQTLSTFEMTELEQIERDEQERLVGLMEQAVQENMFSHNSNAIKLKTARQRAMRYAVASAQIELILSKLKNQVQQLEQEKGEARDSKRNHVWYVQELDKLSLRIKEIEMHWEVLGSPDSLFCMPPLHPARVVCWRMVRHKYFDRFVNFCIIVSCTCLAVERPNIPKTERDALDAINRYELSNRCTVAMTQSLSNDLNLGSALNVIFVGEFAVRVIALSFRVYISDNWNRSNSFTVSQLPAYSSHLLWL